MGRYAHPTTEVNSLTAGVQWDSTLGVTISTTTKRTGARSLRFTSLSSGTQAWAAYEFVTSAENSAIFNRLYLNPVALPSVEMQFAVIAGSGNAFGGFNVAWLTIDSGGLLRLYDEDGQIGSASSAISTGTWTRIELKVDKTGSTGSHVVEAKINGTVFATASNRSLSIGVRSVTYGANLAAEANTAGDFFFDDFALNDSGGSAQTGYPGDGQVIVLFPNATGDNNAWTRGGADSGNNWDQVDENPPNDATDYVSSNTLDQLDDYNLAATTADISSGDTVNVVQVIARYVGTGADGTNAKFKTRVKASASGTVEEGIEIDPPDGSTWTTGSRLGSKAAGGTQLVQVLYDLPGASTTAWTKADLDAAQIGLHLTTTGTNAVRVSGLYLVADFTVGGAAPAAPVSTMSLLGVG